MPAFTIDPDDHVAVRLLRNQEPLANGFAEFENEKELAALAANWPATRLVAIWNKLPGTVRGRQVYGPQDRRPSHLEQHPEADAS